MEERNALRSNIRVHQRTMTWFIQYWFLLHQECGGKKDWFVPVLIKRGRAFSLMIVFPPRQQLTRPDLELGCSYQSQNTPNNPIRGQNDLDPNKLRFQQFDCWRTKNIPKKHLLVQDVREKLWICKRRRRVAFLLSAFDLLRRKFFSTTSL